MKRSPLFIVDSCIGGLSVLRSVWASGKKHDVVFMADYAVNPLGIKSDDQIASVAEKWLGTATSYSDSMVIGCNTLSIRYEQMGRGREDNYALRQVVTMVDCFRLFAQKENKSISHKRILIIGTAFTASQSLYPDILSDTIPGVVISTIAATELESSIARLKDRPNGSAELVTDDVRKALEHTDVAVLACTCFPMVKVELQAMFPRVLFIDPGIYCADLLRASDEGQKRSLKLLVTGNAVPSSAVTNFASGYLEVDPACQAIAS